MSESCAQLTLAESHVSEHESLLEVVKTCMFLEKMRVEPS